MADLDLDEIRALLEQPHAFHVTLAAGKLLAEVERLRRLLGPEVVASVDAYESAMQALADERAESVRLCDLLVERDTQISGLRAYVAWAVDLLPTLTAAGRHVLGPVTP